MNFSSAFTDLFLPRKEHLNDGESFIFSGEVYERVGMRDLFGAVQGGR